MAEVDTIASTSRQLVAAAVNKASPFSIEGISERLFTLAFSGLVYPQIWEDPVVDMEAMAITPECRVVTIASGGCNMMSYLIASPAHIAVVDLNTAHVALNRLKLAAVRHLPDHASFQRFFGNAADAANIDAFDRHVAPHLDAESRAFWTGRDWRGRRRISRFAGNFYRAGLLGRFITAGHVLARLHGRNPARMMEARDLEEQRRIFDSELRPLFASPFVRWLIGRPASLFGLGIPPAQYKALAGDCAGGIGPVLEERLERLACGHALSENYFARQAFGYGYGEDGALPPYLEAENYEAVRANGGRVLVRHISFTEYLAGSLDNSLDRYVLLDAQDWMSDAELNALWTEITRTARSGARVIFRTAAEESLLPGRLSADLLDRWRYEAEQSRAYASQDRSAIYGGFHLYILRD